MKVPDTAAVDFTGLLPPGVEPPNIIKMLSRTGVNLRPFWAFGLAFRDNDQLPERLRELVILRVAALTQSTFVRMQHEPMALAAGSTDAELTAALDLDLDLVPGLHTVLAPDVASLLRFVDDIVTSYGDPGAVEGVQPHFTDDQIASYTLLIGHYVMTAMFLKTTEVPMDPLAVPPPAN
jgi:alkylhydroperoxidase family enzyme